MCRISSYWKMLVTLLVIKAAVRMLWESQPLSIFKTVPGLAPADYDTMIELEAMTGRRRTSPPS